MEVSAELTKPHSIEWVASMQETSCLIGGILSIIHPAQFAAGCHALEKLARNHTMVNKHEYLGRILDVWSSSFMVINIICNRDSPLHRDNSGFHSGLDVLLTVGTYSRGLMELPGLGLSLRYNSGTLVGMAGRVIHHGASSDRDRACLAYYMRHSVLAELDGQTFDWMNVNMYCSTMQ